MQHIVHLPEDLYEAVRKKAVAQDKTTDALVIEWVSEHLEESETSEIMRTFEHEVAAFERIRPSIMAHHKGKFVAIYQGEVIATGDDKLALLDQVREQHGDIVCYIEKVVPDAPRTVRMPSAHVVRP